MCRINKIRAITVNYAGSRRSFTYRIYVRLRCFVTCIYYFKVLATELIRYDQTIWKSRAEIRGLIDADIHRAFFAHEGVKSGNDSLHLRGTVGDNPQQDALLFTNQCNATSVDCLGLDAAMGRFLETASLVIQTDDNQLSLTNPMYLVLKNMQEGTLVSYLKRQHL